MGDTIEQPANIASPFPVAAPPDPNQPQVDDGIARATLDMKIGDTSEQTRALAETKSKFEAVVPEAYRTREWYQNIQKSVDNGSDPFEEYAKQFENAQSAIGSKNQTTPVDIKMYVVEPTTWDDSEKEIGEYVSSGRSSAIVEDVIKTAQAEGVSPAQLNKIIQTYEKSLVKNHKDTIKSQQEADAVRSADFETLAANQFGKDKDRIISESGKLLKQNAPPWAMDILQTADNKVLVALAAITQNFQSKFMREPTSLASNGTPIVASNVDDMRKRTQVLLASAAYVNRNDPGHAAAVKAVQESEKEWQQAALQQMSKR